MAVRTQEELMNQLTTIVGEENTSDEVLNFMTDIRDTLTENGAETIATLRQQVADTDSAWRKRYRDAFMGNPVEVKADEEEHKPRTFEDLFTTN